jgi:stress response protein YsnF
VPRERVRLDKDTVTGEEQIGEEVRKEQIQVDEGGTDVRDDRRP